MKQFDDKQGMLFYLEHLMHQAIVDDRLMYTPGDIRQVTVKYKTCQMTMNTSFDCVERTYRAIKRPGQFVKRKKGKPLLNAVKRYEGKL